MIVRVISESEFTVQGHGVHTAYIELTHALKQQDGVKVIINRRGNADITHLHTVGAYALWYLLCGSGKKVISAHVIPESFVGSLVGAKYWLPFAKVYLRWFYNRADLVLAVSDTTKRELLRLGVTSRVEVFHNVIDTSRYTPTATSKSDARQELKLPASDFIVVSNGQVQPRKRVDSFIATARALPDAQFIWVGGMPFKGVAADASHMQRLIDTAPSNVTFTGVVPLDAVRQYFQSADVFMMPSDQETFGLAIVEAASSGLPVVLRDIPDYDETFRADALMVSDNSFADAITSLRTDKKLYSDMVAASERIAARYDSRAGAQRLMTLFKQLVGK